MDLPNCVYLQLISTATQSTQLHRHGAVLLKGKKIVSSGFNSIYGNRSIHAEVKVLDSFNRLGKENRIRKMSSFTLVVVRWNGTHFIFSKPCKHCTEYIKNIGVKKVMYTDMNGEFVCVKPKELMSDHVCGLHVLRRL